jgi:Tfp pilus assembly protein PilF
MAMRHMSANEFVRRLKGQADEEGQDRHYAFWLGAGCSVTSGIPAAASLVKESWLPELHRVKGQGDQPIEEWAKTVFEDYDPENAAGLYGPLMNELFPMRDDRQRETERLCEGRVPGFGYAVLAALMSRPDGIFSAALTTNFDDLIADSMYVFGAKRPLVIQHGALAGFVRPGRVRRPLVVKVHGDHRLNPMHTEDETAQLEKGIRKGIEGLLHDRGVIFVGYAGNDEGVIRALESLPDEAIPLGVWWVSRTEPTSAIRDWLVEDCDATWVEAGSFDELMLLFHKEFEIAHPNARKFEQMIESYQNTYERLDTRIDELPETAPDSGALKEASRRARETASDWWGVELEAAQYRESDPDRADRIYREGVEQTGDPRLLGNYANFLTNVRKEQDRAEEVYKQALAADPRHPNNLGNFAVFLSTVRKDQDRAEETYKEALAIDPDHVSVLGNYAAFLSSARRDPDRAEEVYKQALAADPEDASNLGKFAVFLSTVRKDQDRAEEVFEQALAADPDHAGNLGAFAHFLSKIRGEHDRAEELYKRALSAAPAEVNTLNSYAVFLTDVREDDDSAEGLYKRALEVDPKDADVLGNYGRLLFEAGRDEEAWSLVDRALEVGRANALLVELWFYVFAMGAGSRQKQALTELISFVARGARSPGWNFDGILDRARADGHPDGEWLETLADVLASRKDAKALDAWPKWTDE